MEISATSMMMNVRSTAGILSKKMSPTCVEVGRSEYANAYTLAKCSTIYAVASRTNAPRSDRRCAGENRSLNVKESRGCISLKYMLSFFYQPELDPEKWDRASIFGY